MTKYQLTEKTAPAAFWSVPDGILNEGENSMKWISVDDRLPRENQWILYHAPGIFDPETSAQVWVGQYDAEDNVFFSWSGFFGGGEVTHWMPVPELP